MLQKRYDGPILPHVCPITCVISSVQVHFAVVGSNILKEILDRKIVSSICNNVPVQA